MSAFESDILSEGPERVRELLAERSLFGLGDEESAELDHLLALHPEVDDEAMDLAAAALEVALAPTPLEPLPGAVRARLEQSAERWSRSPAALRQARRLRSTSGRDDQALRGLSRFGWLALAAALVMALLAVWPSRLAARPDPPAVLRARLMDQGSDVLRVSWTPTEDALVRSCPAPGDPSDTNGDVVWSTALQQGVMRIHGLQPNDPSERQYQLWIFDAARDDRFPVDGGVFDIPADGADAFVAIDPKLDVRQPVAFAVTVEKPGGVVVSDRRVVLLAKGPP